MSSHDLPRRWSDTLFSDVFLPAETLEVRAEARKFADDFLRPIAHEINTTPESRNAFRRDVVKAIADAGLYGIPFSKAAGGRGLEYPTLGTLLVMEELGYYCPGATSALYDGQIILCGQTLLKASQKIQDEYLPRMIKGEIVCCFATSEPDTSTDLSAASMMTTATKTDGGYMIKRSGR